MYFLLRGSRYWTRMFALNRGRNGLECGVGDMLFLACIENTEGECCLCDSVSRPSRSRNRNLGHYNIQYQKIRYFTVSHLITSAHDSPIQVPLGPHNKHQLQNKEEVSCFYTLIQGLISPAHVMSPALGHSPRIPEIPVKDDSTHKPDL